MSTTIETTIDNVPAVEDPRHLARTMLRLFGPAPAPPAGERDDDARVPEVPEGPVETLAVVARGLDELAATVEAELGYETERLRVAQALTNNAVLQELLEAHAGRRRTVLRLLAGVLGELHGDLEETARTVSGPADRAALAERVALVPEAVLGPDGVLVAAEQLPTPGTFSTPGTPDPSATSVSSASSASSVSFGEALS